MFRYSNEDKIKREGRKRAHYNSAQNWLDLVRSGRSGNVQQLKHFVQINYNNTTAESELD